MKPVHWADQMAERLISTLGRGNDEKVYTLASGITPSGLVHVGNFREVITVDLVARALRSRGKKVRFIYSWDNFDTFRKVPKNVPDAKSFEKYLYQPIARIPDPFGDDETYASGRIKLFESELQRMGISPEYLYQEEKYSNNEYTESIKVALEKRKLIADILDQHRSSPLAEDWVPTSLYCEKCHRDDKIKQSYQSCADDSNKDSGYLISYACEHCGTQGSVDIRNTKNLKLAWRVDWPMRWHHERVDFEPGGKDHSSKGGSYDTGKEIASRIWGIMPPQYLQYDFVNIKGKAGKMSSSAGDAVSLSEVLEIYEPQIIRWIFSSQRPNHDFSISFDEDVVKTHDMFDAAEATAFSPMPEKPGKWPVIRRSYELSCLSETMPENKPFRPDFRELCSRLQVCGGDIDRVVERFYASDLKNSLDKQLFQGRCMNALNWLEKYAPEQFRYQLRQERAKIELSAQESQALGYLRKLIVENDIETMATKDLHQKIYDEVIRHAAVEPLHFFKICYQMLIARDQGPRLASFLQEVGKDKLLELL